MAGIHGCWNDFCIASDCNGIDHVDATGYTWTQERGTTYDPATDTHVRPDDLPFVDDQTEGETVMCMRRCGRWITGRRGYVYEWMDAWGEVKCPDGSGRYHAKQ